VKVVFELVEVIRLFFPVKYGLTGLKRLVQEFIA
jgi:hypothetical protein